MTAPQSLREALEKAAIAMSEHSISISMPWDGDLDDLERDKFDGLVAACEAYRAALSAPSAPSDTSAAKALPTQAEIEEMVRWHLQCSTWEHEAGNYEIAEKRQRTASMLEALGKAVAENETTPAEDWTIAGELSRQLDAAGAREQQLKTALQELWTIVAVAAANETISFDLAKFITLRDRVRALIAGSKP